MNWIKYLLEANLYLALFYVAYYLLMRRETYYQLNRAYLLSSSLLAFFIPLLQLGMLKPVPEVIQIRAAETVNTAINSQSAVQYVGQMTIPAHDATINYYVFIYAIIAAVLAVGFGIRIFQLIRLSKSGKRTIVNDFKIIEIDEDDRAFSFFNYLFLGKKLSASDTVIRHEIVHIRQRHSMDIVYLELLKIICWFNPFVYLLQHSIKEVHEFIADNCVSSNGQDVDAYTDFLVSNAYGLPETSLTNNFFNKNLLKTRIMMLHQKRSGNLARLKYLVALPLLAGMLCLSTLGFTKNYTTIDLAPRYHNVTDDTTKPESVKTHHKAPPAPPVPAAKTTTAKGYMYEETGYLVNKKTNFRVIITEKNGEQKEYYKNSATPADLKLLKNKYGYTFPSITLHDKMPPLSPMAPAKAPSTSKTTTITPTPARPKVTQTGTTPKPKAGQTGTPPKSKVDKVPASSIKPANDVPMHTEIAPENDSPKVAYVTIIPHIDYSRLASVIVEGIPRTNASATPDSISISNIQGNVNTKFRVSDHITVETTPSRISPVWFQKIPR